MPPAARRLPPLHTLAAFEAAARTGSFLAAADELAVTPSAVSHRIRVLEERLGVRLFERTHRAVRLTAHGERYLEQVSAALAALEEAGARLAAPERRVLRVQSASGIGATWLAEQLVRYHEVDAGLDVLVTVGNGLADVRRGAVDLAVRYGAADDAGLVQRVLLEERVFPVATRILVERIGLRTPADLARAPLLRHPLLPWRPWFAAAGVSLAEPSHGPRFDDVLGMLEAAARGAGVALVTGSVFARARAREALVRPFGVDAPGEPYVLVFSEAGRARRHVRDFAAWLVRAARGDPEFEPM